MAEIEDVLAELRHRIMGPFESGPPEPARRQQETNEEELAMAQSVNIEHRRHGSAAVACAALLTLGEMAVLSRGTTRYPSRSTLSEAAVLSWGTIQYPR
jgi:hypothetical protein